MKHLLLTTIAAVVLVGCGNKEESISFEVIKNSDLENIKKAIAAGADVNAPIEIRTGKTAIENIFKLNSFKSTINIETNYALNIAVEESTIEAVKLLIDNGADVNVKDSDDWTPLHSAVQLGRKEIVELLILEGANVNAKPRFTPLNWLSKESFSNPFFTPKDYPEIAKILRYNGGKTSIELQAQKSINAAARIGDIKLVKKHLSDGEDVNARLKQNLLTPLINAASHGRKEIVEFLISRKALISAKDINGNSPIHVSVRSGHYKIAELLIRKGANINVKNIYGETPVHAVLSRGMEGTLLMGADLDLNTEKINRRITFLELLINKGADINIEDSFGRTPLDIAIFEGSEEMTELLRKKGGGEGNPDYMAMAQKNSIINPFLKNLNTQDQKDTLIKPSIWTAAEDGNIEVIKKHIEAGANIESKCEGCGGTSLDHAVRNGFIEAAKFLISAGADVNATDSKGMTPLHKSILEGYSEMATMLMDEGADPNASFTTDLTPLDITAMVFEDDSSEIKLVTKQIADLLRKHGGKTGEELKAEGK